MAKMFNLRSGSITANAFASTEQDAVKFLLMVASKEHFPLFEAINVLEKGKDPDDSKLFLTPLEVLKNNFCTNADFMRYRKDIDLCITDDIYGALKANAVFWKDSSKKKRKVSWYAYIDMSDAKDQDKNVPPVVYGE